MYLSEYPRLPRSVGGIVVFISKGSWVKNSVCQENIEAQISNIKTVLKKTARNSTKQQWFAIFNAFIFEKIAEWGMGTDLYDQILQTLISSAHDIAQLAEHASTHLRL